MRNPPEIETRHLPWRRISPEGQHCFFGYYDLPAVSRNSGRCLGHRVRFRDRLPTASDPAEIGWFNPAGEPEGFHPIATTRTWNFQQGSFLQWLGGGHHALFWNDGLPDEPGHGVRFDPRTGDRSRIERSLASVSRDGRFGLSFSFERLIDFRPGYGYANRPDPRRDELSPDDDGIFVVDLDRNESRLLISLATIQAAMEVDGYPGGRKILVNHVTLNPSGDRFIVLARNTDAAGKRWGTFAFTADRQRGTIRPLMPFGLVSHYWWQNDRELLIWCDGPEGQQLYLVESDTGEKRAVDPGFFQRDGHMSLSPDGSTILYDSYPDSDGIQHLYLYSTGRRRGWEIGRFPALPVPIRDLRCDLHPRWNPDGNGITFDSTHEGYRAVYAIDLSEIASEQQN